MTPALHLAEPQASPPKAAAKHVARESKVGEAVPPATGRHGRGGCATSLQGLIVTAVFEDYPKPYSARQDPKLAAKLIQQKMNELQREAAQESGEFDLPLDFPDD